MDSKISSVEKTHKKAKTIIPMLIVLEEYGFIPFYGKCL
jgi:hypothetical protein